MEDDDFELCECGHTRDQHDIDGFVCQARDCGCTEFEESPESNDPARWDWNF